jgi:ABC-type uncharacterized transport system involved in gliding motility auxiliary subunit
VTEFPQNFAWGRHDIRGNCASTTVVDSDATTLLLPLASSIQKAATTAFFNFLHSTFLGILTISVIQSCFIMDSSNPPPSQSTPSKRPSQKPSRSTAIMAIPVPQPSTPTAHQQQDRQQYQQPVNTPASIMRSTTDIPSS